MERKLIFLDIDGTLTEPGKNVPPSSGAAFVLTSCSAIKDAEP